MWRQSSTKSVNKVIRLAWRSRSFIRPNSCLICNLTKTVHFIKNQCPIALISNEDTAPFHSGGLTDGLFLVRPQFEMSHVHWRIHSNLPFCKHLLEVHSSPPATPLHRSMTGHSKSEGRMMNRLIAMEEIQCSRQRTRQLIIHRPWMPLMESEPLHSLVTLKELFQVKNNFSLSKPNRLLAQNLVVKCLVLHFIIFSLDSPQFQVVISFYLEPHMLQTLISALDLIPDKQKKLKYCKYATSQMFRIRLLAHQRW